MWTQRQRTVIRAVAAIAAIWLVAAVGYTIAKNAKLTPEKVRTYVEAVDFSRLAAGQREDAIRKLAAMLNRLSLEERQRLRLDHTAYRWFEQMTDEEKGEFLEATMPTGLKQMLNAFEQMPEDRRRRAVSEAVQRLKTTRENFVKTGELPPQSGTNTTALSPELQQKMATIGLKTFYGQSSAQAKAELAPLLEEMQRMMESGMMFRGGPHR